MDLGIQKMMKEKVRAFEAELALLREELDEADDKNQVTRQIEIRKKIKAVMKELKTVRDGMAAFGVKV